MNTQAHSWAAGLGLAGSRQAPALLLPRPSPTASLQGVPRRQRGRALAGRRPRGAGSCAEEHPQLVHAQPSHLPVRISTAHAKTSARAQATGRGGGDGAPARCRVCSQARGRCVRGVRV